MPRRRGIERRKYAIRSAGLLSQNPPRAADHHDKPDVRAHLKRRRRAEPRVLHLDLRAQTQIVPAASGGMPQCNGDAGLSAGAASTAVDHPAAQRQTECTPILNALRGNADHLDAAQRQRRHQMLRQTADVQDAVKAAAFLPVAVYLLKNISAARLAAAMPVGRAFCKIPSRKK